MATAAAAALLVLATACGSGSPTSRPLDNTGINAEPGEKFTLTVTENPSARRTWHLVDPQPDSSVLVSHGSRHVDADEYKDQPGSNIPTVFTFEAKGKGTTQFTLLQCFKTCDAASDSPDAPERITYTVTVG
ncbi:protease inhibitor I42 family protein [Streptomyces sp. NPDC056600]|uniref:protease inhibitor I42 family protein n=1 Tax=Streptomyces sp. NPDC056600 TaxID=3345874 RepID=UPI003678C299